MPRAKTAALWTELTLEERRERRRLRREKQREDNVKRGAKMHAARLKSEANGAKLIPQHKQSIFVGCSGWRYWKWRGSFYDGVPQNDWFGHYLKKFDTVEINAFVLLLADRCRRSGLAPSARQENVRLYDQGLRAHHPHQEVQGHENSRKGFWHDLGYPRRPDGLFLVSVASELSLHQNRLKDIVSQLDPRVATSWNSGTPVGGMKKFTAPSARQVSSSALAAARACPMSSSRPPMRFTSACMAPSVGIGTITRRPSSRYGRAGSRPAARNARGSISIMITMPMPPKTR